MGGASGTNDLSFVTPGSAIVGNTIARFRLSSAKISVQEPTGWAPDGEVEDYRFTVLQTQREFGDAPASFGAGTTTGAYHNRGTNLHWLGAVRDLEPADNSSANADGDDIENLNDDDGVTFLTPLAKNQSTTMQVVASTSGALSYWVDFDQSGTFDVGEKFTSMLNTGANNVVFVTPGSAVLGDTFMRFRFSSDAAEIVDPVGRAKDGEVEDYKVEVLTTQREYGDAPDSYRTSVGRNGARHNLGPNTHWLGAAVDRETNATIDTQATGDDLTTINDDDGVTFTSLIAVGQAATLEVVASAPGELAFWIDYDRSGSFDNATEKRTRTLVAGANTVSFNVPSTALVGGTYARFRFSTNAAQIANAFGLASNGEVEDYRVDIVPAQLEFGDAPDTYGTTLASNGARHEIGTGNVYLGAGRDLEADGSPSGVADGDDNTGLPDDEDGITFTSSLVAGQQATFTAIASVSGTLTWWLDDDVNGVFATSGERFSSAVSPGSNNLSFAVPGGTPLGETYMRFRFNTTAVNAPTGSAADGEVEDYRVTIESGSSLLASDNFFSSGNELDELLSQLN